MSESPAPELHTHGLLRTSPKGGAFIGRCMYCGQEGLPASAACEPCLMAPGQDVQILDAIDPPAAFSPPLEPADPEEPWHTGDDQRVDLLSGALTALEEVIDELKPGGDEIFESIQGAVEDLQKLDPLLIALVRSERQGHELQQARTKHRDTPTEQESSDVPYEGSPRQAWDRQEARVKQAETRAQAAEQAGPVGEWICRTCGFRLTKAILRASDGAVGVDARPIQDICPNDGASMRPVTWKEDAEAANRVGFEQMKRAGRLETALTTLQTQHRELQQDVKELNATEAAYRRLQTQLRGIAEVLAENYGRGTVGESCARKLILLAAPGPETPTS